MTARPEPVWPKPFCSNGTYVFEGHDSKGKPKWRRRPWRDNAELVAEALNLYAPRPHQLTIADFTYGRGKWWTRYYEPDIRHGRDVEQTGEEFDDGVDFRDLPEADGSIDVAAYDPPYVSTGGEATNADIARFRESFGISASIEANSPEGLQQLVINPGLVEVHRVLRDGGLGLVKCCNYISSGAMWPGEFETLKAAFDLGFELVAQYVFDKAPGPQPRLNRDGSPRVQVNPRNNTSTLYVLRKQALASTIANV